MDEPRNWKYPSTDAPGMHTVVSPSNSACRELRIFRLNLAAGSAHLLRETDLELHGVVISGSVSMEGAGLRGTLERFDSFYVPAGTSLALNARGDAMVYLGGAVYEGVGAPRSRHFDPSLPLGPVHQRHGRPPYEREVFMTLDPATPASRLIAGLTWSRPGAWTSWPPHQHEKDLEEAYFYFDMPAPRFGLHLSYGESGIPQAVHAVSSGDCVIAPRGYHPTAAIPGSCNSYFWVLAARSLKSRRYDLAVEDPAYRQKAGPAVETPCDPRVDTMRAVPAPRREP